MGFEDLLDFGADPAPEEGKKPRGRGPSVAKRTRRKAEKEAGPTPEPDVAPDSPKPAPAPVLVADEAVEDVPPDRKSFPAARIIRGGRDDGLYDIPEGKCLCYYAQGPCLGHYEGIVKSKPPFPIKTAPREDKTPPWARRTKT